MIKENLNKQVNHKKSLGITMVTSNPKEIQHSIPTNQTPSQTLDSQKIKSHHLLCQRMDAGELALCDDNLLKLVDLAMKALLLGLHEPR